MRDAFAAEHHAICREDARALLLTADIGYKVFDPLRAEFPGRFLNFGVAEMNMMGAAAGLALSGKRPFVYTIVPFLTMRAFEQIRVDVALQNLPVRIIGVGGGLAYGNLGPTHHSLEDVAILRALPHLTVVTPCDPGETRKAIRAVHALEGPSYVRLGRNGEPKLHECAFELGKAETLREGDDATILVSGPIAKVALEASGRLAAARVRARVVLLHTIKPFDAGAVLRAARETNAVVSLEEHSILGGLGSACAEVLAEGRSAVPFRRIGVADRFCHEVGSQEHHWRLNGFTPEDVAATLISLLEAK